MLKMCLQNGAVYEIMWTDRQQMNVRYGACRLHAGYLRLQTHTQNM